MSPRRQPSPGHCSDARASTNRCPRCAGSPAGATAARTGDRVAVWARRAGALFTLSTGGVCAVVIGSLLPPEPAAAQPVTSPPFIPTPADLAPSRRESPAPADPADDARRNAPAPRELGKPQDELVIDVNSYSVDANAPAAVREALPRLTAAFVGPGKSYEDLSNAASQVTRFLQGELGYYLGYAYIPEQPAEGGVVRIALLEGRLDRVVLHWDDSLPVDKRLVEGYLSSLKPGEILTVREVERAVFLINDLRGISVVAEVKAGSKPGTAILEFSPKADQRVMAKVDADINGSRYIGTKRLGALLSVNSPFGRGDGLALSALGSTTGGLKFLLGGYTTPIGHDGLKVGFSVANLKYQLDLGEFPLDLHGESVTGNVFGLYPWVRSRNLNLFLLTSYDYKKYTDAISTTETRKRIKLLTLGVTGDARDSFATGAVNTFEVSLAQGRLSYPMGWASGVDDAPKFLKWNAGYTRLQNVVDGRWLVYLSARGQYATRNLDTTEQFRAGGPDGVRAFAQGEGTGDSGLVATTELRWLPPESLLGKWAREIVVAGFYDAAIVRYRYDPNLVSRDVGYSNRASYGGLGLSLVWARLNQYSVRLSIAKPTHGEPKSDPQVRDPRVYLQASMNF